MNPARAAGFSLLELLVVVLIIGLGVVLVTLNIGDNRALELRSAARELANHTALIAEEAELTNQSWGVQIYRDNAAGVDRIAWRWLWFGPEGWQPEAPRDLPAGGRFASDVSAELSVEGGDIEIGPLPPKTKKSVPDIWLAPGGEVTAFELRLRLDGDDGEPIIVRGDALGRIELELGDAQS
jgi:type II secretion system protein H